MWIVGCSCEINTCQHICFSLKGNICKATEENKVFEVNCILIELLIKGTLTAIFHKENMPIVSLPTTMTSKENIVVLVTVAKSL